MSNSNEKSMLPAIEAKIISDLAGIKVTLENQDRVLNKLDKSIHGNGVPGIKSTVERHDKVLNDITKVLWIVGTPVLTAIGGGLVYLVVYAIRHLV